MVLTIRGMPFGCHWMNVPSAFTEQDAEHTRLKASSDLRSFDEPTSS